MRKHYLDNIRWITVVLVVIYHVIYIYNGVQPFGVAGPFAPVQYQDAYQYIVYPWFMMLLFVVSGMSSRYYLENHTDKQFIKDRTRKLLVPSTIGVLLTGWILGYYNMALGGANEVLTGGVPLPVKIVIMDLSGTGVLWYIQLLWVFSVVLTWVRKIEKDRLYNLGGKTKVWVLVVLTLLVYLSAQVLNTPVVTVYRFGIYGVGFFIGYFVMSHEEVTDRLMESYFPLDVMAIALGIAYVILYFGKNYAMEPYVNCPLACAYCWFAVLAIIATMKKYGEFENSYTRFMNRESWGLYIFHYLPIAMIAYYQKEMAWGISPVIIYLLTALAAFCIPIVLYEVVRCIPVLRWCVLGIKKEKER